MMEPVAWGSQCGAPKPANAGIKVTPPLFSTVSAKASISGAEEIIPS